MTSPACGSADPAGRPPPSGEAPRPSGRRPAPRLERGEGAEVGLAGAAPELAAAALPALILAAFAAPILAAALAGCAWAGSRTGRTPPRAPAAAGPEGAGHLAEGALTGPSIRVVYPPSGALVTASDSTFVFGGVRPAGTRVTVNGTPARQGAGGGWLAYVPVVPGDFSFRVEAEAPAGGPPAARLEWPVRVAGGVDLTWAAALDTASVAPRDSMVLEPGDTAAVRFKGLPGLRARAVLGDGLAVAEFREARGGETNTGRRVFGAAERGPERPRPPAWSWYRADLVVPGPASEAEPSGGPAGDPPDGDGRELPSWSYGSQAGIALELLGADSTRRLELPARVELRDPSSATVAILDDDPERAGRTDGAVVARTAPDGSFFLFQPNGVRALTGRRVGGLVELRLAPDLSVWSPAAEVHGLPPGAPPPSSRVPVVRTRRRGAWTRILVPLEEPLPVQVRQQADPARYQVTLFGARAATEFMRYDFGDPLVRELRWNQPADARFVLDVELDQRQPWGFRYGYDGSDFYLDVRRAPELGTGPFRSILKGLLIVVDPGHAPDPGAIGPTGLMEKDANLAVALELARILRADGAEVVTTRDSATVKDSLPGLDDRTNLAARREADLFVSVHHNALPDGVNPFENNGSSTYYYHPQSLPLARAIQRELLDELELPDFGVAHGNLAVVRQTWMPAVLTEAAFMMIPEQEELLRTEEFRRREARAIARGIERFLREAQQAGGG